MNTKNIKTIAVTSAVSLATLLMLAGLAQASTFAPVSNQLGVGSSGVQVTNLQTFLASNYYIYPAGRVTGYYGVLTEAAVAQFQLNYGISPVGNVGPITLAKINNVMAAGNGIDITAPTIMNSSVQATSNGASFNWATNENATGKVYY